MSLAYNVFPLYSWTQFCSAYESPTVSKGFHEAEAIRRSKPQPFQNTWVC